MSIESGLSQVPWETVRASKLWRTRFWNRWVWM